MTFVRTLGLHKTILTKTLPQKVKFKVGLRSGKAFVNSRHFLSQDPRANPFFFVPFYQRFLQIHVPLTTSKNLPLPRKAHHLTSIVRMYQISSVGVLFLEY